MAFARIIWVTTYRNGPSRILSHAIMTSVTLCRRVIMACNKILLGPFLYVVTLILKVVACLTLSHLRPIIPCLRSRRPCSHPVPIFLGRPGKPGSGLGWVLDE